MLAIPLCFNFAKPPRLSWIQTDRQTASRRKLSPTFPMAPTDWPGLAWPGLARAALPSSKHLFAHSGKITVAAESEGENIPSVRQTYYMPRYKTHFQLSVLPFQRMGTLGRFMKTYSSDNSTKASTVYFILFCSES